MEGLGSSASDQNKKIPIFFCFGIFTPDLYIYPVPGAQKDTDPAETGSLLERAFDFLMNILDPYIPEKKKPGSRQFSRIIEPKFSTT